MDSFNRGRAPVEAGDDMAAKRRNRDSLFLMAQVRVGNTGNSAGNGQGHGADDWSDVRVRNLSPGGLMAEIDTPLAIGTPIELELRGVGRVLGRIAWQMEGRTGVAFETQIDPMKARKPVRTPKKTTNPGPIFK